MPVGVKNWCFGATCAPNLTKTSVQGKQLGHGRLALTSKSVPASSRLADFIADASMKIAHPDEAAKNHAFDKREEGNQHHIKKGAYYYTQTPMSKSAVQKFSCAKV
jgi:hypothetical protein